MQQRLPERIDTPRLRLVRWQVEHAAKLNAAVLENIEHLRPWMPWIEFEPLNTADRADLIQTWTTQWEDGGDVVYGVFDAVGAVVGGAGLHRRVGPGAIEIGYWIHQDHTGKGYATEASRSLTDAAFSVDGIDRVEIHTDKANTISARVPERLGYVREDERPDEIAAPGELGINCPWTMARADWT